MTTGDNHVIVVGAGMVGLSTAWFLQERGLEVTVVDRDDVAAGSSWGNAGYLAPAFTLPLPEAAIVRDGLKGAVLPSSPVSFPPLPSRTLVRFLTAFARNSTPARWREAMETFNWLNAQSLDAYTQLAEGGVEEPTQPASPLLAACSSTATRDALVGKLDKVAATGADVDYELLTSETVRALEPALGAGVRAAVGVHGQRFIDPPAFLHALAEAVRSRGGQIVPRVNVTKVLDRDQRGVELVTTDADNWRCNQVVIATGAWMNTLTEPFGVRQPVVAGRGYSFSVCPAEPPTHPIYFPAENVSCTPLGDKLRVTGMMEFRRADAPQNRRRIETIIDSIRPLFAGVDWNARHDEWVGSRPCTADGLPLVGPSRSTRVHIAGGHGMWGIVLGPVTGRMLADQMTGHRVPMEMSALDPLR